MQLFYARLFGTRLATAVAIDGHALAGGCITALACDLRVMSRGTIGLNEAALGLPPPWWINDLLCRVVGESRGEQMLQGALTVSPEKAADIGLVDVVTNSDKQTSVEVAENLLANLIRVPGRAGVKAQRRSHFVAEMKSRIHADTDAFVEVIKSAAMQAELERYVSALQKKR
jgi:3,2-trans-enoyl-CoA isomerase